MVTSLANIFTMEKLVVKIIFGSKSFILIFLWLFYEVLLFHVSHVFQFYKQFKFHAQLN